MPNCSVFCCKKRSATSNLQKDGITFHTFPKDPKLRDVWKTFCNTKRTWDPKKTSVICSAHFQTSDFQVLANNRRRLVDNSIPSLIPDCICANHPLPFKLPHNIIGDNSSATPELIKFLGESSYQQQRIHTVSIEICTPKSTPTSQSLTLSPRKRKMQNQIDYQKIKIKRLQAKNLYLKKKVASLEEILQVSMKNR